MGKQNREILGTVLFWEHDNNNIEVFFLSVYYTSPKNQNSQDKWVCIYRHVLWEIGSWSYGSQKVPWFSVCEPGAQEICWCDSESQESESPRLREPNDVGVIGVRTGKGWAEKPSSDRKVEKDTTSFFLHYIQLDKAQPAWGGQCSILAPPTEMFSSPRNIPVNTFRNTVLSLVRLRIIQFDT